MLCRALNFSLTGITDSAVLCSGPEGGGLEEEAAAGHWTLQVPAQFAQPLGCVCCLYPVCAHQPGAQPCSSVVLFCLSVLPAPSSYPSTSLWPPSLACGSNSTACVLGLGLSCACGGLQLPAALSQPLLTTLSPAYPPECRQWTHVLPEAPLPGSAGRRLCSSGLLHASPLLSLSDSLTSGSGAWTVSLEWFQAPSACLLVSWKDRARAAAPFCTGQGCAPCSRQGGCHGLLEL